MLLNSYNPSVELNQRAMNTARTIYTIGNIWVLPNKAIFENHKDSSKYHGYMDGFLKGMYQVFAQQKNRDKELEYIFNKNRKYMTGYQGEEGFRLFVHNMVLDDYMDANGMPADIFANVWGTMKNLDRETYFNAVDRFCSFCETAIPKRGKLIVDKLKEILK